MKYVESGGDVRATSANPLYMGVVFVGLIDDAIAQAHFAPDHGVPALNGRAELLSFLRVTPTKHNPTWSSDLLETLRDRDSLIPQDNEPKPAWAGLSPYTLEYAMARWPQNFKAVA